MISGVGEAEPRHGAFPSLLTSPYTIDSSRHSSTATHPKERETTMATNNIARSRPDAIPLWLDRDWYITLDSRGYVDTTVYEGTLGAIIQIRSRGDDVRCLKVPRLRA